MGASIMNLSGRRVSLFLASLLLSAPALAREIVPYDGEAAPGTIVVRTDGREPDEIVAEVLAYVR